MEENTKTYKITLLISVKENNKPYFYQSIIDQMEFDDKSGEGILDCTVEETYEYRLH